MSVYDKIGKMGSSIIQHGVLNNRIYLMKLDIRDMPGIIPVLNDMAADNKYTKIFVKVPDSVKKSFIEDGYKKEAVIPGFYSGAEDCIFMGKFLSPEREYNGGKKEDEIKDIIKTALSNADKDKKTSHIDKYIIREAGISDVYEISTIYREVFETYPFPVYDTKYIIRTMKTHIKYYGVFAGGKMVAASSSEMDTDSSTAEMTDFATLPEYRGKGLASSLLAFMEEDMAGKKIKTVYTIARAMSYGINITFARGGYRFSGTLINNTNISGSIESMNVWHKKLS